MSSDKQPELSPYGRWLKHNKLLDAPMDKIIKVLWEEYKEQCELTIEHDKTIGNFGLHIHKSNIPTPDDQLQTAIELLEACSEDLFISGEDADLEARVDSFIKEVKS